MVVTGVQGIRSKAHSRHSVRWTYCNILSCILFFFGWASLVSQMVETLPANAGDPSLISGLGRFPGEKMETHPLQYPCLEDSMDREAWWVTGHGVSKSQTRLSD